MSEAENHQLELERLREQLDCLLIVHRAGHEGTARRLAAHLCISREWQQELNSLRKAA